MNQAILGSLYPLQDVSFSNLPIVSNTCKRIRAQIREYIVDIDDPVILQYQSFSDEFEEIDVTIENSSLSLYNLNDEILQESIFLLSSICYGAGISERKRRTYNPSSFAILLILLDFFGYPKRVYEYVSEIMREIHQSYRYMHPYIGLPYLCDENIQILHDINGNESSLTLLDLDGEFIIIGRERQKVFMTDEKNAYVSILLHITYTYEDWLSRYSDHIQLASLIICNKIDPSVILPFVNDELLISIAEKYPYFLSVLSEEQILMLPYETIMSYSDLLSAKSISILIERYPSHIGSIVKYALSCSLTPYEQKCISLFIQRKKYGNPYAYILDQSLLKDAIPSISDIGIYIDLGIPISFYIHLCHRMHIRQLLQKYPSECIYIYDKLISKFI